MTVRERGVAFENPASTGRTKRVEVGFAWVPFCVLGVALIPLLCLSFVFALVFYDRLTIVALVISLILVSAVACVPLFLRGLFGSAVIWIVLWIASPIMMREDGLGYMVFHLLMIGVFVFAMGGYANKLTAKRLSNQGWLPQEPEHPKVREALERWDIRALRNPDPSVVVKTASMGWITNFLKESPAFIGFCVVVGLLLVGATVHLWSPLWLGGPLYGRNRDWTHPATPKSASR